MNSKLIEKNDRRIYDDEHAFADRASWLDAHQIKEDRRKPRNLVNEDLLEKLCGICLLAGGCNCEQQEEAT